MRIRIISWSLLFIYLFGLSACIREEKFADDPVGNFDQLWKIIDEQYCFLDYKSINWDSIGSDYRQYLYPEMTSLDLYFLLNDMLRQLKDGHVCLTSEDQQSNFDLWTESPRNFNESVIENNYYLGRNFRTTDGLKYKILDDNIGYIYYEKFTDGIGNTELDRIFTYFSTCDGLIIDVRQNGGGNVGNSSKFASRFTNEKVLTGYICHKNGPGHNDFSQPYPIYLEPSNNLHWQKKVAVLTNRHSYSATNDFVNNMRYLPNVLIVGDTTGGGSGMPSTSELPNGWIIRFSASPHFDRDMNHIEWGIDPDVKIDMDQIDENKGLDTVIETARKLLK